MINNNLKKVLLTFLFIFVFGNNLFASVTGRTATITLDYSDIGLDKPTLNSTVYIKLDSGAASTTDPNSDMYIAIDPVNQTLKIIKQNDVLWDVDHFEINFSGGSSPLLDRITSVTKTGGTFSDLASYSATIESGHETSIKIFVPDDSSKNNGYVTFSFTSLNVGEVVNTAPTITGAVASQTVDDNATLTPFSAITLADDENDNLSITIALDESAKGALSGTGLSDDGGGSYSLASDTIANVQAKLRALVFTPTPNRVAPASTETTTFTITANDGTDDSTPNNTTTVISTSINDAPTITSTPITSVDENSSYSYTLGASDVDGDSLTWSLKSGTQLPSWLELNTTTTPSSITTFVSGLNKPAGIVMDSSGNLYIADSVNNAIKKRAADGTVTTLISGLNQPLGVAVDSDGNVYIADTLNSAIKKLDSNETVTTLIESGLYRPSSVAVDSDGNLYIADTFHNAIKKRDADGTVTTLISGLNSPLGVAVDSSGNVYIADAANNAIKKRDADGTVTTLIDSGLYSPNSVAVDSDGNLYIADTFNHVIKKRDTNGTVTTLIDSGLDRPRGVAVDADGNLYIADTFNNAIKKLTAPVTTTKLTGTPSASDVGDHNITLVLSDGVNEVEHNFTITVNNVNDAPTSSDMNITIDEDANKTFVANDFNFTDVDSGDSLDSIYITTLPTVGTLTLNDVNVTLNQQVSSSDIAKLVFTPVSNANGTPYAKFGFKVNDGDANSTVAYTAIITVTPIDDAPTFASISNYTNQSEDMNLSMDLSSNDIDNNTSLITYTVESNNTNIATVQIVDGKLVVTPVENATGTITVEVNATSNGQTATQSFDIEIVNVNDTPTLASIEDVNVSEDFTTFNVTINPNDVDSDNLKLSVDMNDTSIISIPTNSTDWIPNGTYTQGLSLPITAVANKYGVTELNVTVEDPSGAKAYQTFTITVNSQDDAPVANSMAATVGPNSVNTFDKFTPTFSDVDGDMPNTLKIESLPSVGTFEEYNVSGDGNWTQINSVPFEVSMSDLAKYRFNAGDNSGQSSDVNWSIRTTTLWSNTATGVVTIIDPASNNAPDVNLSVSGIVTINEDSQTQPIYITFSDDYTQSKFLVGIVDSNDTSKVSLNDGDFNITKISDNNVSVIITPKANVYGDVNITLGAFDGDKNGTKSFTLRITSVNDIPTAMNFEKTIDEDSNYSFSTLNPSDVYSDTNDSTQKQNELYPDIFQIVTLPQHGALHLGNINSPLSADTNVSINNLSFLVYTPAENNNTDVNFTWRAYDGEAWTLEKTATIHINPVDDAPVFTSKISDITNINEGGQIPLIYLPTSNDVEGDTITYSVNSSDNSIATASIVDGKVVVSPTENGNGTVTITLDITANGKTTQQTFSVDIIPVNDTPIFSTNLSDITIDEDNGTTSYELNATDIEGSSLIITVSSSDTSKLIVSPSWDMSSAVLQADYSQALDFNLTTMPNANGNAIITITVNDGELSASSSYIVNIVPVNDAPTLSSLYNLIVYKNFDDINFTMPVTDVDGDILEYNITVFDTSIVDLEVTNNIVTLKSIDGQSGKTDVNITAYDGEYSSSEIFTLQVLSLNDGDDVEEQGNVNITQDENGTLYTTITVPDDNLTINTQKDIDGLTVHKIEVSGQQIEAISELPGSVVEVTDTGVQTKYEDNTLNLVAEVNATITGKASHVLDINGTRVEARSEFVGATTTIKDVNGSVEIETSVKVDSNTSIKVVAKQDGSATHTVKKGTLESKATSKVKGAKTVIDNSGNVQTSVGEVADSGYTIKALIVTKPNGETLTKFIKVNNSDESDTQIIGNTVKESTPFEPGNDSIIENINGTLFIKINSSLDQSLEIE